MSDRVVRALAGGPDDVGSATHAGGPPDGSRLPGRPRAGEPTGRRARLT